MTADRTRADVLLLAGQAVAFGVAAALLVIPANGIFLGAYGAEWLPLTYIGIAVLGTGVSIVIARSLRRWTLPTVAVVVLASVAATLLGTWVLIVVTGSAWPSVVQLVMFPILIQLGFVIIGGQAGRLLDLQQIKRYFARVVAGFVAGFMLGGFAAVPLLTVLGSPEHLVAVSATWCAVFMVLVWVTARRRPAELTVVDRPSDCRPRPSLRSLLTTRFVVLVSAYQILSAMGSQVLDFLVFDRAAARYQDASEVTRFVALYTGVLNGVDLVFLAVFAGWLLWRFGLRLGLLANPTVVTALTLGMLLAAIGPGPSSLALFSFVVTARIVDIALSDGMTRGSINAVYQVLPVDQRLAVQASVEGIGVPVAIGATGVMLLAMNALDLGTSAIVAFALVLCAAWSLAAIVVYSEYRHALAARLRRRGLDLDSALPVADDEQTAVRRLLLTDDVRDVRLGLDLAVIANLSPADLAGLADHEDRVVRLLALCQLARRGDLEAASRVGAVARQLASADDAVERRAAAVALVEAAPPEHEDLLRRLLGDAVEAVRVAALQSVAPHDISVVELVVAALDDPTTVDAALDAARRLGSAALALAADRLNLPGPAPPRLVRLVAGIDVATADAAPILVALAAHPDRSVSLAALTALARNGLTVEAPLLDGLLADDAALAARALAASTTMTVADGLLLRALEDQLTLLRERVLAVLTLRHGEDRIGGARRALASPEGARRALGVEMLQVSLTRKVAGLVDPVVREDLGTTERLRRMRAVTQVPERDRSSWLDELADDDQRQWRSPWLQAVALHTQFMSAPEHAALHAGRIDVTGPVSVHPALAEVVLVASEWARTEPSAPSRSPAGA